MPSGANGVSAEGMEKIEAERKNLESARDFQRTANEEYLKEKAALEIENQTGEQVNLSIVSPPLAGADERSNSFPLGNPQLGSNLSQTKVLSDQIASNQTQTKVLSDQIVIGVETLMPSLNATKRTPSTKPNHNKGKEEALPDTSSKEVTNERSDQTTEGMQSVLNKQDVLNIAKSNQVNKKRPLSLLNAPLTG